MKLLGIRPAGEAGDCVELFEELAQQLVCVVLRTQLLEVSEHESQCVIRIGDRTLREVLTLLPETFPVSDELLSVEVGRKADRGAQNPIRADDACHSTPRVRHVNDKTSVSVYQWTVKRDSMP